MQALWKTVWKFLKKLKLELPYDRQSHSWAQAKCVLVIQSYLTLLNTTDYGSPGSSVHRILQARIKRGWPLPSPGDLPDPGIEPTTPSLQADSLPLEPLGEPMIDST